MNWILLGYESEAALSMMGVSSVSGLHDLEHPDVVLADEWYSSIFRGFIQCFIEVSTVCV